MRSLLLGSLAVAGAFAQDFSDSKRVVDPATGITYQSYSHAETGITIGIALPQDVSGPYDAIISIESPKTNTWVGFAWGGTMAWNPLTVAWPNGNSAVVSSRFAYSMGLPLTYEEAEYTLLKGTTSNATHWRMNALCKRCTSWLDVAEENHLINGTDVAQFAWAQGTTAVAEPANNASAFNVHAAFDKWYHDLNGARSPNFSSWVSKNRLSASPTAAPTKAVPTSAPTLVTSAKPNQSAAPAPIPSSCSGAGSFQYAPQIAAGWKATKVLGGLTNPRQIKFDTLGNMLVVQPGKGISYHKMSADGCVSSSKTLTNQNNLNHGIALSVDGKTLYASAQTAVYSWPYDAAAGTIGTRATVVTGMYQGGSHLTRTLELSPHAPNILLVSHGSNSNLDHPTINPKTGRSVVRAFDISKVPASGYNYQNDGYLMGYGLRNEVGICFDAANMLWGVENSADQFTRTVNGQSKDIHNNNPAERLHYLGDITTPNNNWYGYPTCFSVWEPSDFTDTKMQVGDQFVIAPNTTFKDTDCSKSTPPSLVFQAHSAPIDCKFDADSSNMYISFHGSWNRSPVTGFRLIQVPFTKNADGTFKPTAPLNSQTGYTDVVANKNVASCAGNGPSMSSGCFRPAGIAFDSQQRMYMTSDTTQGEVWVLGKS